MTIAVGPFVSYRRTRLIAGGAATFGWGLVTLLEPSAWPLVVASIIFAAASWTNLSVDVPSADMLVVIDFVAVMGALLWVRPFPGAEALGLAVVFGSAVVMSSGRWLRWLLPGFTALTVAGAFANSMFREDPPWSTGAIVGNATVAVIAVAPILFWVAGTIARAFPSGSLLAVAVPNPAEFAHTVVERSREGLAVIDFESRIRFVNAAFAEMFGFERTDMIGGSLSMVMDDDTFRRHEEGLQRALLSEEAIDALNLELVGRHRSGDPVTVLVSLSELGGGGERLVLGAVRDVSEMVALRRDLEESVRSKDRFVAAVSHELRTPLTAVVAFARLLRERDDLEPAEHDEFVDLIVDQSGEMSYIIEDLLVASRLDTADMAVSIEPTSLRGCVLTVVDTFAGQRSVAVDHSALDQVIAADPGRVRQILRNLVGNAVKHGGSSVAVTAKIDDAGRCHVIVRDDGPGVPGHSVEALFEAYTHGPNVEGQPLSVGLGLNVSRRLAELMDGRVEYRRVDDHTEFVLVLPLADLPTSELDEGR